MNLGELTGVKLLGVLILVAVVATGGLYYTVYQDAARSEQRSNRSSCRPNCARTRNSKPTVRNWPISSASWRA